LRRRHIRRNLPDLAPPAGMGAFPIPPIPAKEAADA
jgi:hypothetical protein